MDQTKLVRKAKRGNKDALLTLIMNKQDEYYRLSYTYMGNKHDALDAMEDMILVLYEKIHSLKKEDAFYSWSKTILVNSCKNLLRKRKKWMYVEDITIQEKSSGNVYTQRDQQLDIQQMLSLLNEDQAEAIRLKYLCDMDYKSISHITNVSMGTVKSRVFQGLKKLKLLMGGEENEEY
ncbi:RNA polymerase sigma factor [Evansella sp. AB-rgal1]|uniref:RNA polymerase sigma factor n=1 Tax=Evansella sp. AB-rgal1 TaxID=3242696 RepID=UPI00359E6E8A